MYKSLFNKFFVILIIFLFIIANFSNVFATTNAEYEQILDKINNYMSEHYYNGSIYIIFQTEAGYAVYQLDGTKVTISLNSNKQIQLNSTGFTRNTYYYFDTEGNYLSVDNSLCMDSGTEIITSYSNLDYIYSTNSIYDSEGNIVNPYFPPQEITQILVEETTKAQIMEKMKIIIVGFLKYLIVLVVSLIAFWKGWQFLSMQLKKV